MAVEYGESVHNMFLADGYYDSPETLVKTLNGEKPGRVQFSYNSVTQKVCAHMKNETKFTLYGDLFDILGFGKSVTTDESGSTANSIVDLRRGFESLYVYSSLVEPRIVGEE